MIAHYLPLSLRPCTCHEPRAPHGQVLAARRAEREPRGGDGRRVQTSHVSLFWCFGGLSVSTKVLSPSDFSPHTSKLSRSKVLRGQHIQAIRTLCSSFSSISLPPRKKSCHSSSHLRSCCHRPSPERKNTQHRAHSSVDLLTRKESQVEDSESKRGGV